jgi:hypothetical protein
LPGNSLFKPNGPGESATGVWPSAASFIGKHRGCHSQALLRLTSRHPRQPRVGEHLFEVRFLHSRLRPLRTFSRLPWAYRPRPRRNPDGQGKGLEQSPHGRAIRGLRPARRFSASGIGLSREPIPTRLLAQIEPTGFLHSPPVHDARAAEGTEAGWCRREGSIWLSRGRSWVDWVARTD